MSSAQQYSIRWCDSSDQISAELWETCFGPPLEGLWLYRALEQSGLESQFRFSYALIEAQGKAVGIAPTFLMDVPIDMVAPPVAARILKTIGIVFHSFNYLRTLFVGCPCSDEGTVGLLPGVSLSAVAPALQDALLLRAAQTKAPIVVWKDFPAASSSELKGLGASHGVFSLPSFPGTRVAIGTGGFEGYLKRMSGSQRHNVRKKLRRGKEAGALETSVVQHPDAEVQKEIFELFWQTYLKGKTKFERLTPRFFELIAAEDMSHFILLRHPDSGKLAAFMLCFKLGSRVINKFIGMDYALGSEWYLYFRLWEAAIDFASAQGAEEFQSGQTGYRPKLDLGSQLVPLTNHGRHRIGVLNKVFAKVAAGTTWSSLDEDLKVYLAAHPEAETESTAEAQRRGEEIAQPPTSADSHR